jgi:hypothetical protein
MSERAVFQWMAKWCKMKTDEIALQLGCWFQMLQWIAAAVQKEVEHYMTISDREGISADGDSAEKWQEYVNPVITWYALKDIFNLVEMAHFCNVQPKGTLAFKGEKFKGKKRHKDRVTVMLICSADGSAVCPFIVNKCEKPHCLRIWRIIHVIQNHTKMYRGLEDCFLSCWSPFKRNLALLMDMCAAHSDVGITV